MAECLGKIFRATPSTGDRSMPFITHSLTPDVGFDPPRPSAVQTAKVLHLINGEHYSGAERVQDLLALGCRSSASRQASPV